MTNLRSERWYAMMRHQEGGQVEQVNEHLVPEVKYKQISNSRGIMGSPGHEHHVPEVQYKL
jgi:hypothetical protein